MKGQCSAADKSSSVFIFLISCGISCLKCAYFISCVYVHYLYDNSFKLKKYSRNINTVKRIVV